MTSAGKRSGRSTLAARLLAIEDAERRGWLCYYCGRTMTPAGGGERAMTADHRIAVAHGGTTDEGNVVALCRRCNGWKGHRDEATFLSMMEANGALTAAVRITRPYAVPRRATGRCNAGQRRDQREM